MGVVPSHPRATVLSLVTVTGALAWLGFIRGRQRSLPSNSGHSNPPTVLSGCDTSTSVATVNGDACSHAAQEDEKVRKITGALVQAAGGGELPALQKLLLDGAPLDGQAELLGSNWTGISAVAAATLEGHEAAVRLLLESRADPDLKCQNASCWDGAITLTQRDTALCIASKQGHLACAKLLLAAGADPNVTCESEFLEGAVEWGDEDDGTEVTQYSALEVAEQAGHNEVAALLQQNGGVRIVQPAKRPTSRKMISSGSRMGA